MINHFYLKFIVFTFVVSTHCLAHDEVRGLSDIQRINSNRCNAFNSDSNEVPVGAITKTKDVAIADYTGSINTFLTTKKNVNPERHANEDEQRDILQPLMATAIIYGLTATEATTRYATPTYANHGLTEGHALYWHFEILRAVEHLSGLRILQIKDHATHSNYLEDCADDYTTLLIHGRITSDMFDAWFAEMLLAHGKGIVKGKTLSLPSADKAADYVSANGIKISDEVVKLFKDDDRLLILKRRKAVDAEIKRQRRRSGEIVPVLKKHSSYEEGVDVLVKSKTARKLKGLNDDSEVQITEYDGYEILEDEIMSAYMWTDDDLKNVYKHSALLPGSIYKFRSRLNARANGKTRRKFQENTAVIISHLKNKRGSTALKVEEELELLYKDLKLTSENLTVDERLFMDDPKTKSLMAYMIKKTEIIASKTKAECEQFKKECKERYGELVVAERLLIADTKDNGASFLSSLEQK